MTLDPLTGVVHAAISSCQDEYGVLDPAEASSAVLDALYSVATVTPITPPSQALWDRFVASLGVREWWDHVTPEERATFPLTDPVVRQNWALLEQTTDFAYSTAHRPAKVPHG